MRIKAERESSARSPKKKEEQLIKEAIISETEGSQAETQAIHQKMVEGNIGAIAAEITGRSVSKCKIAGVICS